MRYLRAVLDKGQLECTRGLEKAVLEDEVPDAVLDDEVLEVVELEEGVLDDEVLEERYWRMRYSKQYSTTDCSRSRNSRPTGRGVESREPLPRCSLESERRSTDCAENSRSATSGASTMRTEKD